MIPNNNLNILPFYEATSEWSHLQDNAYGEKFSLTTPDKHILPFQIYLTSKYSANPEQAVFTLYNIENGTQTDITKEMQNAGLQIVDEGDDAIIIFNGKLPINVTTPQGLYYLKLDWPAWSGATDDVSVLLYSEQFNIKRKVSEKLKLRYKSYSDQPFNGGKIDFTTDSLFEFTVYIDTALNTPEYPIEEQGTDRDGHFFVEKQISTKLYKFNFLAPEFICDATRIARLMDEVTVEYQGKTYEVERLLVTPEWQTGGFWAAVQVEMHCDTVVKKIGGAHTPSGGGYQEDYNNDYKKQ